MNKKENLIISVVLSVFIPSMIMVFFWWPLATLTIFKIVYLPDSFIMISSLLGLVIGIIIDILVLKRIIPKFYKFKYSLLIMIYLLCSVLAVSFFMGLPIGNLILGMIAGLYIGRRYNHLNRNYDNMKRFSNFTAFVTAIEALLIGIFMLQKEFVLDSANQFIGLKIFSVNRILDILLIIILCMILFLIQYVLTKIAIKISYNNGMKSD